MTIYEAMYYLDILLAKVSSYVCQQSLVFPCFLFCFGEQLVDS